MNSCKNIGLEVLHVLENLLMVGNISLKVVVPVLALVLGGTEFIF